MKRTIAVMTGVIVLAISGAAFAEMDMKGMMNHKGMDMKMCQGMMDKPSMVAVKDGVVILSGNKLSKYDNKLNLIAETELQEKKPCCKMMEKMIKEQADGDEEAEAALNEAAQPAAEHKAHH